MIRTHLRYAVRGLIKSPGFTAVAMLTLALGIGANTAIFSIVNGVLLKPLPFPSPERLVVLNNSYANIGLRASTSPVDHADYRKHKELLQDVMSVQSVSFNYSGIDRAERWAGAAATASTFQILGIKPIIGRMFTEDEDQPGNNQVALLDEGLWRRTFGGRPDVIGQKIRLNEKPYQVIGVIPQSLGFLVPFEVWVPAGFTADQLNPARRGNQSLFTLGRLTDGLSPDQARDRLQAMTEEIRRANPGAYPPDSGWSILMTPITELLTGTLATPLFTLLGAVGFVLLIACANVANLLLARGSARGREMGIRSALGATRGDLIGQMLAESAVLGAASGLAGLAAGYGGLRALIALAPANFPRIKDVTIDAPVLLFTLALSLLTGLLFGLLPALQAGRVDLNATLKDGARGAGLRRGFVRPVLVVGEVALSTLLLIGAGLLVRSFFELQRVGAGFNPAGLISYRVALPQERFETAEKVALLFDRISERTHALPGVQQVGVVSSLPFSGQNSQSSFNIEGRDVGPNQSSPHGEIRIVNWEYLQAMQIPLKAGRGFTSDDRANTETVALVDENLARLYWPNGDAIGKRMRRGGPSTKRYRIIGVVGIVKHAKLDSESKGAYYFVLPQARTTNLNVMVRASGDPAALSTAMRSNLSAIDRDLPMFDVKTMGDRVLDSMLPQRVAAWLLGILAFVALLLAAVGIYGVLAQNVQQRTAEIGIRMALGAQQGQVLGLVLREGLFLTGIGIALGTAAALGASKLLTRLLYGISPTDAPTYGAVVLVLGLVATLACLAPAYRAARVDPLIALRYD